MNRIGGNDIHIPFANAMRLAPLDGLAAKLVKRRSLGRAAYDQCRSSAHHIHNGSVSLMAAALADSLLCVLTVNVPLSEVWPHRTSLPPLERALAKDASSFW